jgi:hypothetical protein
VEDSTVLSVELEQAFKSGAVDLLCKEDPDTYRWFLNLLGLCLSQGVLMAIASVEYFRFCKQGLPQPMLQIFYAKRALIAHNCYRKDLIQLAEFVRRLTNIKIIVIAGEDGLWRYSYHQIDAVRSEWFFESLPGARQ